MSEPLYHYTATPLGDLHDVEQPGEPDHKPCGLWLSAGDGEDSWPEWCRAETFGLHRLACRAEFALVDGASVLALRSAEAIDQFNAEYGCHYSWRQAPRHPGLRAGFDLVDWKRVAEAYDGIIIAPYVWARRLEGPARWYYSWDVASGCFWRPTKALIRIEPQAISEAA